MIKKELTTKLWNAALGAFGFAGTVIGLFTVQGTVQLPWRLIIIIGIITFVLVCVAIYTIVLTKRWTEQGIRYPIQSIRSTSSEVYFYTKYTETLPVNALVTVNYEADKINDTLALALVTNYSTPMENDYVELQVKYLFPQYKDVFEKAKNEQKRVLNCISIKPAVRHEKLDKYLSSEKGGDTHG